jgi:hypothetical protein
MPNAAVAPFGRMSHALTALAVLGAALLGTGAILWAWFGTAVFFDMLAAGLAYCF